MPNPRVDAIGRSPLPTIIDQLAQSEPDSLWAEYPTSSTTLDDGFQQITYGQFARAVNGSARRIEQALGRCDTGETLAYLAPNDPRCSIAVIAAMKAGFNLFLLSERNDLDANLKLLNDVQSSTIVTTSSLFPPIQRIVAERKTTIIELPALEQLVHDDADYSYDKDLSTMHNETAFMVHSSGSTGFPKPMHISHGYLSRAVRNIGLEPLEGYEMLHSMTGNNRSVLLLPLSHGAGVHFGILNAFFNNAAVILPLPGIPPTGEALLEMLQHTHADWAAMAPLTLETISKNSALLDGIAGHLKMLLFAGGSLPDVFGDEISSKIRLLSHLGSSESGPLPTMYRHGYDFARDWNYLQLHPAVGAKFDPQPDGAFELVFKKTPETEPHQTVFTMYPDLTEYRTKDLFTPHPSLPDVWTHASRSDDVIVFLNGEKTSPTIFESHVSKHPEISVALMFGSQRFEAGLLIELCDQRPLSAPERAEAIQRLWPTIDSANRVLPTYAQVSEAHICFTDPGAPVLRTLKGSIRRHATIDQYAVKINKLYADVAEMWAPYSSRVDLGAVESIRGIVQKSLQEVTKIGGIGDGDDFFREGMDSLQVLRHVRQLRAKTGLRSIHPGTIYLHPSVRNLASALYALANRSQTSELQREEQQKDATQKTLEKYLDEIESLPKTELEHQVESDNQEGEVVLLTGSTGSIGSYIMRGLMNRSDVTHIYCLNRSSNSVSVQKERNAALDPTLPSIFPKGKVTFLTASLSERTFGLQPSAYAKLCNDVTLVIHSAWPVDFNLPLQSFEAHLEGIVSMASFCAQSKRHAAMLFVSTVSAAMNYAAVKPETRVPEAIINNFLAPPAVGYSQSKHVGEIMVAHAAHQLNLRNATILRLGQIAGAAYSPGRWKQTDWIPTMVRSSQYLGVLPDSVSGRTADRDVIDWLPIDTVSDTVIEIGLQSARESGNVRVFNILSPQRTSWQALLPAVVSAMEAAGKKIKVVSPSDWIAKLRASAATSMDPNESDESGEKLLAANPALRLIGFFSERFGTDTGSGSGLEWDTNSAEEASERLRNAEKIDGTMMERWVKQWCAG